MVFARFTPVLALAALASSATAMPRINPSVHRTLRAQGVADIIVTFKQGTTAAIASVQETQFTDRGAKISALVTELETNAATSQAELFGAIAQESAGAEFALVESYWLSNQVYFKGASVGLVGKLASLPSIAEIREELVLPLPKVESSNDTSSFRPLANEWGIDKVQAPDVWAAGFNGQGVVVGAIDTGALHTHEALKDNWRSTYGWFDPGSKRATPFDDNGHGTHVVGTIAGSRGIGVAPGATWIACRGCTSRGCSESDLLGCAQFMTCPTDAAGGNKDCSKAPRIVSNSWGGGQGDTFYKAAVDAWQAAGIIPIFANGNSGPACTTANSPGDMPNVIAVGATDSADGLARFSSKGPSRGGLLKPEVSGPGVSVRSAWFNGVSSYNTISGTSMATPHVSGIVALLLSAKSTLNYNDIKSLLTTTVDTATLQATTYNCGTSKDGVFPNNMYGYGRVNSFSAYNKAVGGSPPPPPPPTTITPPPTTTAPAPTTPAPTTVRPSRCTGLGFWSCIFSSGCSWTGGRCVAV